jgi:protein farnesyltransferase/geranylgeranyltransferase type-1 subunit alpha
MILVELGGGGIDDAAITKDLDFADDLGGTNPKNYQLWYHRRALLEIRFKNATEENGIDAAKKELKYVDRILEDDSKNYHVRVFDHMIIKHFFYIICTILHPNS